MVGGVSILEKEASSFWVGNQKLLSKYNFLKSEAGL